MASSTPCFQPKVSSSPPIPSGSANAAIRAATTPTRTTTIPICLCDMTAGRLSRGGKGRVRLRDHAHRRPPSGSRRAPTRNQESVHCPPDRGLAGSVREVPVGVVTRVRGKRGGRSPRLRKRSENTRACLPLLPLALSLAPPDRDTTPTARVRYLRGWCRVSSLSSARGRRHGAQPVGARPRHGPRSLPPVLSCCLECWLPRPHRPRT
jgi:hypothetical protein